MRVFTTISLLLLLFTAGTALGQGRAYREINFGDSFETVTNKVLDDLHFMNIFGRPARADTSFPQDVLKRNRYVLVDIAGSRYQVHFAFYDEKLFRVSFYSDDNYSANYFSTTVTDLRDSLVDVISRARGRPTRTPRVSFLDMQTDYIRWSHIWAPSGEGVEHFIGIGQVGYTYYAAMRIQWAWLAGLYEAALERDADEAVRDSVGDF